MSINEFDNFKVNLDKQYPELVNKKYFYLNIWSLGCKPCEDEIPFIDNLAEKINKEIGYIMVSVHSNKAVNSFLINKNIKLKNFVVLNEMSAFIIRMYEEIGLTNHIFPAHLIIDKKGNALAYLIGSFLDENSATPLINFINQLE